MIDTDAAINAARSSLIASYKQSIAMWKGLAYKMAIVAGIEAACLALLAIANLVRL